MVERGSEEPGVAGSIPALPTPGRKLTDRRIGFEPISESSTLSDWTMSEQDTAPSSNGRTLASEAKDVGSTPTRATKRYAVEPPVDEDPRYKDWRSLYEADKRRGHFKKQ